MIMQPPDKAVQGVNHCLIKTLPFNQLPCIQVLSSRQSAEGFLETMKAKDGYLQISPLQMQIEKEGI